MRAEIARKEEERSAAVVTGPPGVIEGIDKAIERLSAEQKDLREKLSALQANIVPHIGAIAAAAWWWSNCCSRTCEELTESSSQLIAP